MIKSSIDAFKDFLVREPDVSLCELEEREREFDFPIIKRGVQDLLRMLMVTAAPKRILELGTGVGYSSILMAHYNKKLESITTVELKEPNFNRALKNIAQFGYEDKIHCVLSDAKDYIETLNEEFDFIFVDCAKGQYASLWEDLRTLIRPGGIVLTDDVMQNKTIISSRFLLNRRDRTIHKRMRKYLHDQMNDSDFDGAIFDIDDGISLLTKKVKENE